MGKASRWFRALFGLPKPDPNPVHDKKKWTFPRPHNQTKDLRRPMPAVDGHAMAVAAATAAVAEAAVAAAQAAAAVVKLTSSAGVTRTCAAESGGGPTSSAAVYATREERAAVTIQSHFRGYLAKKALRALKALIKLQALAKGYIFRKQFSEYLRQMQAVARLQARLRAGRVSNSECSNSSTKSSSFNHNSPTTLEKFDNIVDQTKHRHTPTLKRNLMKSNYDVQNPSYSARSRWMGRRTSDQSYEQYQGTSTRIIPVDDERTDKILEVDPGKPTRVYRRTFHSSHDLTDQSWDPLKFEESSSPLLYSASSSVRGPFTPTKSDGSKGNYMSGGYYLDHPSYMAYTESSKAKVRSVSAPRQRLQEERSSSMNRYSVHAGFGNNTNESRVNSAQKVSALHASFTSKAYPGSGRLDRMGMPVRDVSGFSGGHWQRF